jgi:putative aldouronate transport system permease protein
MNHTVTKSGYENKRTSFKWFLQDTIRDFKTNKAIYLMLTPVILYYLIFHYKPMYGAIIAFKDFTPSKGIMGSPWVGFKHFQEFFTDYYFMRILKNTLIISINSLIFSFPAPIILALLLNELKSKWFSRTVQTISYMPHFISMVVICGILKQFTMDDGIITYIFSLFGFEKITMLSQPQLFVPIYVGSGIWQEIGWGAIIYLAALTGIDQEQYEAAKIDGANRWKQTLHVTLPGIAPTIIILLILRMGSILSVGFEKIILLYNPSIYETADVISTYVYRKGLLEFNWSFSSAVGLFNSVINFILIILANWMSKKVNETSLW